jgi:zinc protease
MTSSITAKFLIRLAIFICILAGLPLSGTSQVSGEPERMQLLNGLRIVVLHQSNDQDVLLKLRIHSGSAFDLAGKGGSAALLGDILFPDPATREYFSEEMQGRLNVSTGYDSITITMQGRAREFERILEILRTAVVTPQLTPDNFVKARDGRIKVTRDASISPVIVADRAIAARLFGDFPYGRPNNGSVESLERVERTDLMLTRDRFLNPNNASLIIIGGVQPSRALRAARQLLGGWRKSEQIVPATFRQPVPPAAKTLVINGPADQSVEVRLAVRGLARKDPDTIAANLLAIVLRQRLERSIPELSRSPVFVKHEAFALPGMFVMGASIDHLLAGKFLNDAQEALRALASSPVLPAEIDQAKSELLASRNKELAKTDGVADAILDVDTYGVTAASEQLRMIGSLTPNDLQRVAAKLFKDVAVASVVVGNADLIKSSVGRYGNIELIGEVGTNGPADPNTNPAKTQPRSGSKP